MTNPKAAVLIAKLEKLNKDVAKSGILIESITPEQEYLLRKILRGFNNSINDIEVKAPVLRIDRLKVFVNHLKNGKLSQKFQLDDYTLTAEYVDLFPEYWGKEVRHSGITVGKYLPIECDPHDGEKFFFGLTRIQQKHLTYCYNQNPEWGNVRITGRTGLAKFIQNMEQFIEFFEKGGLSC